MTPQDILIARLLEDCLVCKKPIKGKNYACKNIHIHCEVCFKKLIGSHTSMFPRCTVCKKALEYEEDLEKKRQELIVFCPYDPCEFQCVATDKESKLRLHQAECSRRPFACLFSHLSGQTCPDDFVGDAKEQIHHLTKKHDSCIEDSGLNLFFRADQNKRDLFIRIFMDDKNHTHAIVLEFTKVHKDSIVEHVFVPVVLSRDSSIRHPITLTWTTRNKSTQILRTNCITYDAFVELCKIPLEQAGVSFPWTNRLLRTFTDNKILPKQISLNSWEYCCTYEMNEENDCFPDHEAWMENLNEGAEDLCKKRQLKRQREELEDEKNAKKARTEDGNYKIWFQRLYTYSLVQYCDENGIWHPVFVKDKRYCPITVSIDTRGISATVDSISFSDEKVSELQLKDLDAKELKSASQETLRRLALSFAKIAQESGGYFDLLLDKKDDWVMARMDDSPEQETMNVTVTYEKPHEVIKLLVGLIDLIRNNRLAPCNHR